MGNWFSQKLQNLQKLSGIALDKDPQRNAGAGSEPEPLSPETKSFTQVLEVFADGSFDIEDVKAASIQRKFLIWAAHIKTGLPVEVLSKHFPRIAEIDMRPRARDFSGLISDFRRQHLEEGRYISGSLRELRKLLWVFVKHLGHSLVQNEMEQNRIEQQVETLKKAVGSANTEDLRQATLTAIRLLSEMADDKKKRYEVQMQELAVQLERMKGELYVTRRELALDGLTRIYNRKAFDDHLAQTVDFSNLMKNPATLLIIDIDHFKAVNDTFGHPAGDVVLKAMAKLTLESFSRKNEFVARYGGEEFCVILTDETLESCRDLMVRFLRAVRAACVDADGHPIKLTVSVGAAQRRFGESGIEWLKRALAALYAAKAGGRDKMVEAD